MEKIDRDKLRSKIFMGLAKQVAQLSTCNRAHVGAIIVKDGKIVATGYNGSMAGEPHCDDVGHLLINGSCKRTIHAEANAIYNSSTKDLTGSTIYVTHAPCFECIKALKQVGVKDIIYNDPYRIKETEEMYPIYDIKDLTFTKYEEE